MISSKGVARHPYWMSTSDHSVFTWLHEPEGGDARPNGVLLCPPFGFEYAHAHRSLVHLADRLAGEGFLVMRMEYPGTGDSTGHERSPELAKAWLGAVADAADAIQELTGGAPPHLVGLRLGALLAGAVAGQRPVGGYVAWAPITRGRAFVREIRALDLMSSDDPGTGDILEGGGFGLAAETAEQLVGLNLYKLESLQADACLVIDREDQPIGTRLLARTEELGVPSQTFQQSDYLDMVAEPHFTKVPDTTLEQIVAWLSTLTPADRVPVDASLLAAATESRSASIQEAGLELTETLVLISTDNGRQLFGVLCEPTGDRDSAEVVLLPNAGSAHHIGPNRLYVEAARTLGSRGVSSLRFDLRNLGDSRVLHDRRAENHPYPDTATSDVHAAVRWCVTEGGYERCTLTGLCSGAHTAFHAAHELPDAEIHRVVSINPLTYRYVSGMSLKTPSSYRTTQDAIFYQGAMFSPARWGRLLRGQSDLGRIAGFGRRWIGQTLASWFRTTGRRIGIIPASALEHDLLAIEALGRSVHFVFSSTDPGHSVLLREALVTVRRLERRGNLTISVIPDADHTFSKMSDRESAIEAITEVLRT